MSKQITTTNKQLSTIGARGIGESSMLMFDMNLLKDKNIQSLMTKEAEILQVINETIRLSGKNLSDKELQDEVVTKYNMILDHVLNIAKKANVIAKNQRKLLK